MSQKKYSKKVIEKMLSSYSELDNFYLIQISGYESSVIAYFDRNWKAFNLIVDDETMYYQCIEFLVERGCRVLTSIEEEDEFEIKVQEKKSMNF